jgi:organic radical activating enzyme
MSNIKVSELFYSLQGEGKYVGVPSVFLRVFGCNFTCSGFGMPLGENSTERLNIDPEKYSDYNDLPLVHTGCDSYASWDPRFKHLSPLMSVETIVDQMQDLLPDFSFGRDKHLIITGGEPLLGWQKSYPDLLDEIINRNMNLQEVTFETNGTFFLTNEIEDWMHNNKNIKFTFSVSAKLPNSGHSMEKAIRPEVLSQYCKNKNNNVYLKLVVSTKQDIEFAQEAIRRYKDAGVDVPVYLMPVGGTNESYEMNEKNVADYCRDKGYRFSPRIQVPLYRNAWGT